MKKFSSAYHGGDGRTGFFELSGWSTIDIDTEDDFRLAEVVHSHLSMNRHTEPQYYDPKKHLDVTIERDTTHDDYHDILYKDGVENPDFLDSNHSVVNIDEIIKDNKPSWAKRLVNTENNSATLICQKPGEGNRRHYHPSWNEWWYIIKGQWQWQINQSKMTVKEGEMVFIPKNTWHKITAIGDKPAVRLAVSREDVEHVYKNEK